MPHSFLLNVYIVFVCFCSTIVRKVKNHKAKFSLPTSLSLPPLSIKYYLLEALVSELFFLGGIMKLASICFN